MGAAERLVGIDLGGTAIKAGALPGRAPGHGPDNGDEVLARRSVPVELDRGGEHVLDQMAVLARELAAGEPLEGLGLGTPGLIDREAGLVIQSPNLAAMEGVRLRDGLARRLDLDPASIRIENDANAAAYGEHVLGTGRGVNDMAMLTLGTGVGGGLVLGGRLFTGTGGMAGELGHLVIDPEGPPCGCGNRGCLEQFASATAARRRAEERGLPPEDPGNLELLTAAARRGDGPERRLLLEIGTELGRGIGVLVTLLDLRHVVIGGGFGAALDQLQPGIRTGIERTSWGTRVAAVAVVPAGLGADAGWIGAARLAG